jgi:hypothetical protein
LKFKEIALKNIYLVLTLLVFSSLNLAHAATEDETGQITKMRAVSSKHPSAAVEEIYFKINAPMHGCAWLKFSQKDTALLSLLLASKSMDSPVKFWFASDSCYLLTIEMQ